MKLKPFKNSPMISNNNRGFSFVELIVASAVISVIMTVVMTSRSEFEDAIRTTNTATEVSLLFREAQSNAINAKGQLIEKDIEQDIGYGIAVMGEVYSKDAQNKAYFQKFFDRSGPDRLDFNGVFDSGDGRDQIPNDTGSPIFSNPIIGQVQFPDVLDATFALGNQVYITDICVVSSIDQGTYCQPDSKKTKEESPDYHFSLSFVRPDQRPVMYAEIGGLLFRNPYGQADREIDKMIIKINSVDDDESYSYIIINANGRIESRNTLPQGSSPGQTISL